MNEEQAKRSGQIFIAYSGTEFSTDDIIYVLRMVCPIGYTVKPRYDENENVIFAKIVCNTYADDRDPLWDSISEILTVNGYNQDEMENANKLFSGYGITDPDRYHQLTHCMFRDYGNDMFKMLGKHMHFCTVIWDRMNSLIIAGVTEPSSEYTHLFYGYTRKKHELMFSNSEAILQQFCGQITKMPNNTYMKNGRLYSLDGKSLEPEDTTNILQASVKAFWENANMSFAQITMDEYLASLADESETPRRN